MEKHFAVFFFFFIKKLQMKRVETPNSLCSKFFVTSTRRLILSFLLCVLILI